MFQVSVQDGLARAGAVVTKHATIATPAPMLYTRRGTAVFLSPDMLERLRPSAAGPGAQLLLQVNALQL
jgi:queuine/archaeosine tRNA-ribosyltransferase